VTQGALNLAAGYAEGAQKSWRRLDGQPRVIEGVKFTDGIEALGQDVQAAAA
jgi:hypothetical protein